MQLIGCMILAESISIARAESRKQHENDRQRKMVTTICLK